MRRIKFTSMSCLNDAEGWLNGTPEIFVLIITGSKTPGINPIKKWMPNVDRSEWKNCNIWGNCEPEWFDFTLELLYWNKDDLGDTMKYSWFEHDSGDPVEITSSVTTKFDDGTTNTNSIKTTISNGDFDLGIVWFYIVHLLQRITRLGLSILD